jgi:para-nitrobenzyl esterase
MVTRRLRTLSALTAAGAILFVTGQACAQVQGTAAMATLEAGTVRGVLANSVISWKGIPYAAPPVGELRWRNPQPALPWTGVKDTNRFGPACMQTDNVPKSEDCLTLNVWRPARAPARPLPVMVWMHGGAMVRGGASSTRSTPWRRRASWSSA